MVRLTTRGRVTRLSRKDVRAYPVEPLERRTLLSAGDLDTSFGGGDGIAAHPDAGHHVIAVATAVQPDGKVVVAGHKYDPEEGDDFVLSRYHANGTVDTTFGGGDGRVVTDFAGGSDVPAAVLFQPDGRIVVAGTSERPGIYASSFYPAEFAVARYLPDGTLDTSFGGDGKSLTRITARGAYATSVARQQDGKILVAGWNATDSSPSETDMAVVRYNLDGSHDTSFGGDGRVQVDFGDSSGRAVGVGVRTDGKIVLGGTAGGLALVRLNPDGSLDPSFGTGGRRVHSIPAWYYQAHMLLQADNKVVFAYDLGTGGAEIARFTSGGSLDTSFGTRGRRPIPASPSSDLVGLTRTRDGRYLVGIRNHPDRGGAAIDTVVRLSWNGNIDRSFGGGDGVAEVAPTGSFDQMVGLAALPNGRVVAAGIGAAPGHREFSLAGLTSYGTPDPSFRFQMPASGDLTGLRGAFSDVAVLPDGRILAVGTTQAAPGSPSDMYVARFNPDGTFDTTFSGDGKVTLDLGGNDSARRLAVRSDGKFIVFGSALLRFHPDGRLDTSFGGGDGIVPVAGEGMGLQPDNRILVVEDAQRRVSRYTADGALDTTFGSGGHFADYAGTLFESFTPADVAYQPGGRVIVGGNGPLRGTLGFGVDLGLIALTPSGQLDLAWGGGDGTAWADSDDEDVTERIAVAPDGRISIAGHEDEEPTPVLVSADGLSVSVWQYPWDLGTAYDTAWTPTGDAVTVGRREAWYGPGEEQHEIGVASTMFPFGGPDGVQTDVFGESYDVAYGVAVEPDGDVVVAGVAGGKPVLLRYKGQNTGDGIDLSDHGELVVVGTDGADTIEMSVSGGMLTVAVNGTANTFHPSLVRRIWVDARGGDDTVTVGDGVPGRAPNSRVYPDDDSSVILGGDGNDRLVGGAGNHIFSGGAGDDHLDGGSGADVLIGDSGTDTADYSSRTAPLRIITGDHTDGYPTDGDGEAGENDRVAEDVEWVRGGSGDDYIAERSWSTRHGSGFAPRNVFFGNGGNDTLDGGLGVDAHFGGAGDDTFVVENPTSAALAGDYYNGGGGTDTIDYSAATARGDYLGIVVTLDGVANDGRRSNNSEGGGAENDNIEPDVEGVFGTAGADRITGAAGENRLVGNGGDDVLTGGGGRDTLEGGDGNDTLFARDGITDVLLNGGAGYDRAQRDASDPTQSIEETLP